MRTAIPQRLEFRLHSISIAFFVLAALILVVPCALFAAEDSSNSKAEATEQLKQLNDQTIIGSRIFLDTEWDQFVHGAGRATWTVAGLLGWRLSECQDWAVRLKLPFTYYRSDEASEGGLGDVELGTGTAFRLSKTWRTAGGIELHADTASDSALAEKVWRLKPGWGIAHDVTNWFTLTFNVEYNYSIAEHHNIAAERYVELLLPGTIILPSNWSILATYKTKVDFESSGRWSRTVDGGIAKRLANIPLVISATVEKPFNGGAKKFQANFTMTYFFEK
jgi:hypothetical protein